MIYLMFLVPGFVALMLLKQRRRKDRELSEDILKYLREQASRRESVSIESLCGVTSLAARRVVGLLERLERSGLLNTDAASLQLTATGEQEGLRLIRNHRLWETHLKEFSGLEPVDWHTEADVSEHRLGADEVNRIEARLGFPRVDPHGDPIPSASGDLDTPVGVQLNTVPEGEHVRILHLEDEPPERFARLKGLYPGLVVEVTRRSGGRIHLSGEGDRFDLSTVVANAVTVEHVSDDEDSNCRLLTDVPVGLTTRVLGISNACTGPARRRLLDLGIVPGTTIQPAFLSASGDPTAYRVRNALVALRQSEARFIRVDRGF
jgi:DtxR family transcriptional regulator, Mn-dependent transcriptional regulator